MKQIKNSGKIACVFLSLLLISVLNLHSQEARKVNNFNSISFNISGDLYVEQGDSYLLKLEGEAKDLEKIITLVERNSLIIKTKNHSSLTGNIKIYVTLPILNVIDLAGSGDVIANKTIKTDNINLSVTGSGDILFNDLQTTSTQLSIAGSGDIRVLGNSKENLKINITGSGDVNAIDFNTKIVSVEIVGSGSANVFATEKLKTEIVGSGSVSYKGDPLVDANSVGSGKTKHAE